MGSVSSVFIKIRAASRLLVTPNFVRALRSLSVIVLEVTPSSRAQVLTSKPLSRRRKACFSRSVSFFSLASNSCPRAYYANNRRTNKLISLIAAQVCIGVPLMRSHCRVVLAIGTVLTELTGAQMRRSGNVVARTVVMNKQTACSQARSNRFRGIILNLNRNSAPTYRH